MTDLFKVSLRANFLIPSSRLQPLYKNHHDQWLIMLVKLLLFNFVFTSQKAFSLDSWHFWRLRGSYHRINSSVSKYAFAYNSHLRIQIRNPLSRAKIHTTCLIKRELHGNCSFGQWLPHLPTTPFQTIIILHSIQNDTLMVPYQNSRSQNYQTSHSKPFSTFVDLIISSYPNHQTTNGPHISQNMVFNSCSYSHFSVFNSLSLFQQSLKELS